MASGFSVRHLLDLHATLRRQHAEVQLGGPVERERRVVLLGDVARLLDPDDLDDVALDVHPEDGLGVGARLVGVGRELDAARLAAATHLHLRLHDHRVAERVGHLDRLATVVDRCARRHRDAVAREQLLALIFEQIHERLLSTESAQSWLIDPGLDKLCGMPAEPVRHRSCCSSPPARVLLAGAARRRRAPVRDQPGRRTRRGTSPSPAGLASRIRAEPEGRRPVLLPRPLRRAASILLRARGRQHRGAVHRARARRTAASGGRAINRSSTATATSTGARRSTATPTHRSRRREQGHPVRRPPHEAAGAGTGRVDELRTRSSAAAPTRAAAASRRRRGSARPPRSCRRRRSVEDHALAELVVGDVVADAQPDALGAARTRSERDGAASARRRPPRRGARPPPRAATRPSLRSSPSTCMSSSGISARNRLGG